MARDNEDRIVELQNRVDDMNLEVVKQRKEIQEYKGKEKNSLDQISAVSNIFIVIIIVTKHYYNLLVGITYIQYPTF